VAGLPEFHPERLLTPLVAGGVDFVVIGGLAVIAHGYVRTTKDIDIVYDSAYDNLDRLGEVLVALKARLRGVDEDLPFVPDGRTLRRTGILTLTTSAGWIDLLVDPPGAPPYRELRASALRFDLFGTPIAVASLRHLKAMKRAAGRPADDADLDALAAIERLAARRS
jgi:hypothetical protein